MVNWKRELNKLWDLGLNDTMALDHWHRARNGHWYHCECPIPYDKDNIMSYGVVPLINHRVPGNLGDINLWNL